LAGEPHPSKATNRAADQQAPQIDIATHAVQSTQHQSQPQVRLAQVTRTPTSSGSVVFRLKGRQSRF
jgi:hypothetical protein